MNCKPGDLAVVIHDLFYFGVVILRSGYPVRLVKLIPANHGGGGLVWQIEEPIPVGFDMKVAPGLRVRGTGLLEGIDDADLRPLRPDGVTDEEVRDLYASSPAPIKETEGQLP